MKKKVILLVAALGAATALPDIIKRSKSKAASNSAKDNPEGQNDAGVIPAALSLKKNLNNFTDQLDKAKPILASLKNDFEHTSHILQPAIERLAKQAENLNK